jgi:hypothetical protein
MVDVPILTTGNSDSNRFSGASPSPAFVRPGATDVVRTYIDGWPPGEPSRERDTASDTA